MRLGITAAALALAACAHKPAPPVDRVVLLPRSDGSTGLIVVQQGGREARLDQAYAAAEAAPDGTLRVSATDATQVRTQFADALKAAPPAPLSFTVYFVFGEDELTEESRREFVPVLQDVARRPAPEITVIGHTDRTGTDSVNDVLALRRAERVRGFLVQLGVAPDRIAAVGRGSREPAVPATGAAAEARNRRVEISVR